jgi:hypothetical protein
MVPAHFFDLKSLNYDVITIEFVNYFPTKFNGNILFELLPLHHLLGHSEQLQVMDKKYNGHVWCKLQTSKIKNVFGLGFRTTKCLRHFCCQNDFFFCFNIFLRTMKLIGDVIVPNYQ